MIRQWPRKDCFSTAYSGLQMTLGKETSEESYINSFHISFFFFPFFVALACWISFYRVQDVGETPDSSQLQPLGRAGNKPVLKWAWSKEPRILPLLKGCCPRAENKEGSCQGRSLCHSGLTVIYKHPALPPSAVTHWAVTFSKVVHNHLNRLHVRAQTCGKGLKRHLTKGQPKHSHSQQNFV